MTDAEAESLLPAVNEFVLAVVERDQPMIQACLHHTPAATLAILCAELLAQTRTDLLEAWEALLVTEDIHPRGVSKLRAWEIAVASVERKSA